MLALFLLFTIAIVVLWFPGENSAQKALAKTRQSLRDQGFKTDVTDFDFSTTPELQAREAALSLDPRRTRFGNTINSLDFLPLVGADAALVIWKQDWLSDGESEIRWKDVADAVDSSPVDLDAVCRAALSGPIRFNLQARQGAAMILPQLGSLRNLNRILSECALLDLHDGDQDSAYTNLLAVTRLVTAWEPESTEISQVVRCGLLDQVYRLTWQCLQTNCWSDTDLARLQHEWESVELFKNLPDTAAFARASASDTCQRIRAEPGPPLSEVFTSLSHNPRYFWPTLKSYWTQMRYRTHGSYEDEKALLLFYRDRELELRNAVTAPTWLQMRTLPGVTNRTAFTSPNHSRLMAILNTREIGMSMARENSSFLARIAGAEANRRLIIAAIALERYRLKYGNYPASLEDLFPAFLVSMPVDFMDGQPLRYHLKPDGHFVMYSVGLDCTDDGGKPSSRRSLIAARRPAGFGGGPGTGSVAPIPNADIVWPRPASTEQVELLHHNQQEAARTKADQQEEAAADYWWEHTAARQAKLDTILASRQLPADDPEVDGRPLHVALNSGTNQLSITDLLTLKQVVTGDEPDTVTFQIPVNYDALAKVGSLRLFIDPDPKDDSEEGANVGQFETKRAENGDCLLVWRTIFETTGRHALQAAIDLHGLSITGPLLPFAVSNLCQFSVSCMTYNQVTGAILHAQLPEPNASYSIDIISSTSNRLKTITGVTSNSILFEHWDLTDEKGVRYADETFDTRFHITLTDSGQAQTLKGP